MRGVFEGYVDRLVNFLSSRTFFLITIILAVVGGLWYAVSYKPVVFDEHHHISMVRFYSENPNPFSREVQDEKWDSLGDVRSDPYYLFYVLLSIPFSAVKLVTDDSTMQILSIRLLMIAFFVVALWNFRKVFTLIGAPRLVSNLSIFSVVVIPNISYISGVVNYDNGLIFLFSFALLFTCKIIKGQGDRAASAAGLAIASSLMLMVKMMVSVALLVPVFFFLLFYYRRKVTLKGLIGSTIDFAKRSVINRILLALTLIFILLPALKPVVNIVSTGTYSESCSESLGEERCRTNPIYERDKTLQEQVSDEWRPYSPYEYALVYWIPSMINTNLRIGVNPAPFPVIHMLFFTVVVAGSIAILVNIRRIMGNHYHRLFVVIVIFYTGVVFLQNYRAYISLGEPVAMNGRYLLPVLPLMTYLVLLSFSWILRKYKSYTVGILVPVLMFLLIQGGWITTLVLTVGGRAYFENSQTIQLNAYAKGVLSRVVVEHSPFRTF